MPARQIFEMILKCGKQLLVFQIPKCFIPRPGCQKGHIRDELSEADFGRMITDLSEKAENFLADGRFHGSKSLTVGRFANGRRILPTTSTRTFTPGASFAMRVARV